MKLARDVIAGAQPRPGCTIVLLHGILGSAKNWRSFARRLVAAHPAWTVIAPDLRCHGESVPTERAGIHDLAACAADLDELVADMGAPRLVVGHSFGGKVALAWTARRPAWTRGAGAQTWVLDANPYALTADAVDPEVRGVLELVARVPMPISHHDAVRAAFLDAGFSEAMAGWMTTNLRRAPDGLRWRFDLDGVRSLLADYVRQDFGDLLAAPPCPVHLVQAGRSDRWTPAILRRLAAAEAPGGLVRHVLPDAGHWVHVDDPDGLLALLGEGARVAERAMAGEA
jgi:pimeloyl-ACP methyl ester carboxylesterase